MYFLNSLSCKTDCILTLFGMTEFRLLLGAFLVELTPCGSISWLIATLNKPLRWLIAQNHTMSFLLFLYLKIKLFRNYFNYYGDLTTATLSKRNLDLVTRMSLKFAEVIK